jgi:hypothetical protein
LHNIICGYPFVVHFKALSCDNLLQGPARVLGLGLFVGHRHIALKNNVPEITLNLLDHTSHLRARTSLALAIAFLRWGAYASVPLWIQFAAGCSCPEEL